MPLDALPSRVTSRLRAPAPRLCQHLHIAQSIEFDDADGQVALGKAMNPP